MRKELHTHGKVLSVRMEDDIYNNLLTESERKGISLSEIVREAVTQYQIRETALAQVENEVRMLREEIATLRRELALVAEVTLSHAGKVPEGQAREWVIKSFRLGKS